MQGNTLVECEILNVIQGAGIWPDCDDKTQLLQAIETLITGGGSGGGIVTGSEIGAVSAFAMPTPPTGWLVCDGSAISRTEYADLFATIGTLWGHGDQVSTFNLPDLRGEFVRGFDDGRGVDDGREFASAQAGQIEEHAHNTLAYELSGATGGTLRMGRANAPDGNYTAPYGGNETRPRNISMTYAIKAFYPSVA